MLENTRIHLIDNLMLEGELVRVDVSAEAKELGHLLSVVFFVMVTQTIECLKTVQILCSG